MANFRKSFNFRNGVQVDNDNLVVNSNGLVGIGTTVPTEALDVRGTAKVVGLVTASDVHTPTINVTGVGTFGTITDGKITISAGIITAVTGVVTFYGDGAGLVNIPTSQWVDTDVGLGFTSIYAAGNVGVATIDPRNAFQVGGNPNNSGNGVGFNSTGSIRASGIITASSFSGSLAATNLTGTIDNARLPSSINVSGVVTATTFVGSFTGTATTATALSGTPSITVDDVTAADISATNTAVSGISTVTTELNVGAGGTALTALNTGRLGIGTAEPSSELQIRKASGSLLEVVSDSGQARVSIGQSVGVGKSTGVIRFGNSAHDFDIINNDNEGDINFLLNGNGSAGTGKFSWKDGNSFSEVMSLNANGNFSVSGVTTLASNGGITTTGGALYVNNNLSVGGTISATNITLPSVISSTNLNNNSGITTVAEIHIVGDSRIGIGSTAPIANIDGIGKTAYLGKVAVGYDDATTDINTYNLAVDGKIGATEGIFAPSFNFTVASGVVTAFGGFVSYGNTAVQIFVEGSTLRFNVVGIGSTTLALI
jgi:hypothetical protein